MNKLAIILSKNLRKGEAANIAGILGMAISGKAELLGEDVVDRAGLVHAGITKHSLIVLKATLEELNNLRKILAKAPEITVVDFPEMAKSIHNDYLSYSKELQNSDEINYHGIAVFGPIHAVVELTRNLSLYG